MSANRFHIEPLGDLHNRAAFACGVEALDRYLHRQAGQDMRRRVAAAFVLAGTADHSVAGYYTLSATSVVAASLPIEVTKRLPRYPLLPAVLLGRLAVDSRYRGRGFGELLLGDALQRCLDSTQVAAMAVIVDAKDAAARTFYERYGFQRLADNEFRLFIQMSTIAQGRTSADQPRS
ncbi:MAG: GNAT family N-acetyltransferase [Chloroflexi bacterium]|nr:GNAT family N-acetyltransferase [Chloroflexota bacterium]